jgi:hypothetical protein
VTTMKKLNSIKFEDEYLLLHNILSCLREAGFSNPAVFRQDQKRMLINSYNVESSHLYLTSLVGVLNYGFDKFKNTNDNNPFWRNKLELSTDDFDMINISYSVDQVMKAVDILEFNGDVSTEIIQKDNFPQNKNIILTPQGFSAFAANKYLRDSKVEKYSNQLHRSTIRTNYFVIFSGALTVIFAALAFWVSWMQFQKKDILTTEDVTFLKREVSNFANQKKEIDTIYMQDVLKVK